MFGQWVMEVIDAFKAPWAPVPDKLAALRAESLRARAQHWENPGAPLGQMAARDIEHGARVVARGGEIVMRALGDSLTRVDQAWRHGSTEDPVADPRWTARYWGSRREGI